MKMSPLTVTEKTKFFDALQEAIDYVCLAVDNGKSDKHIKELVGGLSKSIVSNLKLKLDAIERIESILWSIYEETKF